MDQVLSRLSGGLWINVEIHEELKETFKQATRGRPGKDTRYVREVHHRYRLEWKVNEMLIEQEQATDGIFPLITNQLEMTPEEIWRAYKRQPFIEKRFSQFKSDFEVAPVYLKETTRIQAMLTVYFFVLMVQTLLERELRIALAEFVNLLGTFRDALSDAEKKKLDYASKKAATPSSEPPRQSTLRQNVVSSRGGT